MVADLSSLVEVDEATSDVVWVAVGDESYIFEKHSDVGDGRDWSDAQLVSIVLVVGLNEGGRWEKASLIVL